MNALIAAAVVQVLIALVVGGVQATRGRIQQQQDEALAAVRGQLDEERRARVGSEAEFRAALQSTRDEYSKRVDTQASLRSLEERMDASERRWKEEHKEMRGELKKMHEQQSEMRGELREVRGDLSKILDILGRK